MTNEFILLLRELKESSDEVFAAEISVLGMLTEVQQIEENIGTLTVATGEAGTEAIYDPVLNLLTIPRGDSWDLDNLANITNAAIARTNIGLGNVDNTADANKPISTATQSALYLKSDTNHNHDIIYEARNGNIQSHIADKLSNPHAVNKLQVGLGNANNTADIDKPISTATQNALNLKSDATHNHESVYEPKNTNIQAHVGNITSNPHAVTKSQVGLGNADNTSDANKPVSTATQTALNGKSDTSHNHSGVYEPVFSKNSAFNKNFGLGNDNVMRGDYTRKYFDYYHQEPVYKWVTYGGSDLNWMTIANITMDATTYEGCHIRLEYFNPKSNYGANAYSIKDVYSISMVRSGETIDSPNNALIYGTDIATDKVRVVKTATGAYQVQIRQITNYVEVDVQCQVTTKGSGTTVTYVDTPATGSSTGTIYYPQFNNEIWKIPTLANSWVEYATTRTPKYFRNNEGTVFIVGMVKNGTVGAAIFTLPLGYRPNQTIQIATQANGAFGGLKIAEATGEVILTVGSNVWTSIVCSFKATQ